MLDSGYLYIGQRAFSLVISLLSTSMAKLRPACLHVELIAFNVQLASVSAGGHTFGGISFCWVLQCFLLRFNGACA